MPVIVQKPKYRSRVMVAMDAMTKLQVKPPKKGEAANDPVKAEDRPRKPAAKKAAAKGKAKKK
jgi:hypothetical protein